MALIFDTHAHYDDHAFDEDRKDILSGLLEHGVGFVMNAAASARSMPRILRLTQQYDFMFGAAGLHPCETYGCGDNIGEPVMHLTDLEGQTFADSEQDDLTASWSQEEIITADWTAGEREMQLIDNMLRFPKIRAVGEIGLDYHYDDTRKDVQQEWFARQIALARSAKLPIIVHSRDAAQDTLDMIRSEKARDAGGIIHCFSYGREMAAAYLDMGFLIGIGGVVTYKNAKKIKEVVSYIPMEQMVLETDCPYLAPAPFRGKRNDSSMIRYVAEAVGALKGLDPETVIAVTQENAKRVYGVEASGPVA